MGKNRRDALARANLAAAVFIPLGSAIERHFRQFLFGRFGAIGGGLRQPAVSLAQIHVRATPLISDRFIDVLWSPLSKPVSTAQVKLRSRMSILRQRFRDRTQALKGLRAAPLR